MSYTVTSNKSSAHTGGNDILCSMQHILLLLPFNGLFSRTTWVSRYQKSKTNLDFTGARDSEWQWHQLGLLGHVQVCTSLQTDNHASTPPLCFLQAGCPSCRSTNSIKALKALMYYAAYKRELIRCQLTRLVPQTVSHKIDSQYL